MASGAHVRAVRDYLGADIDHLAGQLGVNERTIRRWESGSHAVPAQVIDDLWDLVDAQARLIDEYVEQASQEGVVEVPAPVDGDNMGRARRIAAAAAFAAVPDMQIIYRHDPLEALDP